MPVTPLNYADVAEMLVVGLARSGDRAAFEELVRRRQTWIRNLMRRCCGDAALADDLAQQVFLQAWKNIRRLQQANRFAGWLKRLAVNTWLQHLRKNDPLKNAAEQDDNKLVHRDTTGVALDLERALATLSDQERLCVVLSYHESLTHGEIAEMTDLPLGTVKSHIRRGTKRLRETLSAYTDYAQAEELE